MAKFKKIIYIFVSITLLQQMIFLLLPTTVHAEVTGTWLSRSAIKIGDTVYFDSKTDADSYRYERQDDPDVGTSCIDKINTIRDSNTTATLIISTPNPSNAEDCKERTDSVKLLQPQKSYIFFVWNDAKTLATSDQQNIYTLDSSASGKKLFFEKGGDNCKDSIELKNNSTGTLIIRTNGDSTSFSDRAYRDGPNAINPGIPKGSDGCKKVYDPIQIAITMEENAEAPEGSTTPPGVVASAEAAESCADRGDLSWLICPIIKLLDGGIVLLDNQVSNLLEVKERTPEDLARIQLAETRIRNFAYLILIPIMLVMVISTALGFEFVSAYTVKKALPRLVVAVLFIALSGQITRLIIDVTNSFGAGISGLLLQPFIGNGQASLSDIISSTGGAGVSYGVVFGAIAAGTVLGGAAIPIVLSYALVTFVSLFAAFALLAARQVFIIVLALLAPLAILAWIFPGNDKLWKLWWGSFTKLLLLYPIIILLITSGKVFASFVRIGQPDGILSTFLVVTAYIAPYFLIPTAFKFAGGAFATLAGMANDRSRGLFDRQRKFRGETAKAKHAEHMGGMTKLGSGMSGRLYRRVGSPSTGLNPTAQGRRKFAANERVIANQAAAKMLEQDAGRSTGDDDATALAVQDGMTASKFISGYMARTGASETRARDALAALEVGTGARIGSSSMQVAAFKARAASSTAYDGGEAGTAQRINEGAALIRSGLITASDATAAGKGNRNRLDISGLGYGDQMKAFQNAADNGDMDLTGAANYLDSTLQSAEPGDLLGGNTRTIESMAPAMMRNLNGAIERKQQAVATGDKDAIEFADLEVNRALGQIAGVQDNLNRTSPQKAAMFADAVNGQIVHIDTESYDEKGNQVAGPPTPITVRQAVENAANRPADTHGIQTFLEVRKEYGSAQRKMAAEGDLPTHDEEPQT